MRGCRRECGALPALAGPCHEWRLGASRADGDWGPLRARRESGVCFGMVPGAGVQWLAVQLLNWFDAHLLALHQRRKMRAILSLGGCSRTAPRWADTAVQLVQPQIGRRQWSWQLRWRAFGCAERCRSSQQHRSSLGAALDVFVCLSVLVDVVVVVELRRWLPMVNLYL